jgi:hypothetical protein
MRGFSKNKKFLLIILLISGIFFFGSRVKAATCNDFNNTNLLTCNNADVPPNYCEWVDKECEIEVPEACLKWIEKVCRDCNKKTEISWPISPLGTRLTGCSPLTILVKYFYEWGIALGGLAAFISLIIGGFQYLTSMGEPAGIREAKDRIYSAFFGLILLLGSWLILKS